MKPHKRPKRFGTASNSYLVGWSAFINGLSEDKNPYKQGTDDYKRWKKGYRNSRRKERL